MKSGLAEVDRCARCHPSRIPKLWSRVRSSFASTRRILVDGAYAESNVYGAVRTLNKAGTNIGQAFTGRWSLARKSWQ